MATSPNYGWLEPDNTDLVKNGALAIRTLGNAIDTTMATMTPKSIVDAKGDLIAASAADTPARLAVGNNGETLVADSSTATGLRYNAPVGSLSNFAINGGMDVWQRGTSFASSGGPKYTSDRWYCYRNAGASGSTFSRQNASDANLPNIQYSLRVQRDSGDTQTSANVAMYNGETVNSIPYAGKTITISFYARKGANYSSTSDLLSMTVATGTGTDQNLYTGYTGLSNIIDGQTVTLTSSWQRFAFTGTVAATAKQLGYYFYNTPVGTASTNDWFEITGVQIDVGTYTASTAPTFRRSGNTIQGELALCQRYYYTHVSGTALSIGNGGYYSASQVNGMVQFPVTMRIAPTLVASSGTDYYVAERNGGSDTFNSLTIYRPSTTIAMIYNGSEASGTAGNAALLYTNNASSSIAFSAEL